MIRRQLVGRDFNPFGQVGQPVSTVVQWTPARIGTATSWTLAVADGEHEGQSALALRADGSLWGWGLNTSGQVGDGTTTSRSAPTRIGSASNWATIGVDGGSSSGIRTDGTLWTWGSNLVNPDPANPGFTTVPAQFGTETYWKSVSVGRELVASYTVAAIVK